VIDRWSASPSGSPLADPMGSVVGEIFSYGERGQKGDRDLIDI